MQQARARTPTQRLLDIILGQPWETYVAEQRAAGLSWRAIERDLFARTEVLVTGESLRMWSIDAGLDTSANAGDGAEAEA